MVSLQAAILMHEAMWEFISAITVPKDELNCACNYLILKNKLYPGDMPPFDRYKTLQKAHFKGR